MQIEILSKPPTITAYTGNVYAEVFYTTPSGCKALELICIGAGGGGSGSGTLTTGGSGGIGGGCYIAESITKFGLSQYICSSGGGGGGNSYGATSGGAGAIYSPYTGLIFSGSNGSGACIDQTYALGGKGGDSMNGGGGVSQINIAGTAGTQVGAGGGGGGMGNAVGKGGGGGGAGAICQIIIGPSLLLSSYYFRLYGNGGGGTAGTTGFAGGPGGFSCVIVKAYF